MAESNLLTQPLTTLTGVGSTLAVRLAKLNLHTLHDLLLHLPLRYEDKTRLYSIVDVLPGERVTVEGEILRSQISMGHRQIFTCVINDGSGSLTLRFFHFTAAMKKSLSVGKRIKAYGEIKRGKYGLEISHPQYQLITSDKPLLLSESLTPIYPAGEGVQQALLRKLTDQVLARLAQLEVEELLPPPLSHQLMGFRESLITLHRPTPEISLSQLIKGKHPAQKRLIFEELLAHNLSLLQIRAATQQYVAHALTKNSPLSQQFLAKLPFQLTTAQQRVIAEIKEDLAKTVPMMRLVQGDVGSGKTVIAALAALTAISQGKQVALMVPTELLAEQHLDNFRRWFTPLGINIGWLVGKQKGKVRQQTLVGIKDGLISMIIGTHAIFQDPIHFKQLALIIIDEQHRFGVHQRLSLWEKGKSQSYYPHQLIMTATPIPRTLAMTAYADLDTSTIDELPPGRTAVTTVVIGDQRRKEIIERVKQACLDEKRQAYWVCTLIELSDVLEAQAAEAIYEELQQTLPELKLGLVHGRMKTSDKQAIMQAFKAGDIQLLIATTVIEVGVDVPNASLMIIENPERLGLAQLHQLRGRVGRGAVASHCVLLYKSPLSKIARQRLQVLRDNSDGFIIAQHDLMFRGPGELLGTRQTGSMVFKIADLLRDQAIIEQIRDSANLLQQHYPEQAKALLARWLPEKGRYGNA